MNETWLKQCGCAGATASGPRLILSQAQQPNGGVLVQAQRVRFACDRCDTPWALVVEAIYPLGHA